MIRFLKDPLVHFLVIGAALFAISAWRGESIEVASDRPFVIYADGDPIGATPATLRVEPRCLRVITPA